MEDTVEESDEELSIEPDYHPFDNSRGGYCPNRTAGLDEQSCIADLIKRERGAAREALYIRARMMEWASEGGMTLPEMVAYIREHDIPEQIRKPIALASDKTIYLLHAGGICEPPGELLAALMEKDREISTRLSDYVSFTR